MHNITSPGRLNGRRVVPAAAAALTAVALAAPGANAQDSPISVDVAQDSVLVTGLPFGQAKLQITRPDLRTGSPVVIGEVQGISLFGFPFGANTTAPTLLNPLGDCWQAGVLALAGNAGLTPDILPGDTATVVGGPTYTVPMDAPLSNGGPSGPIAGCDAVSLFGKNIVTDAQFSGPGTDLAVSGHAQPGAKAVSVFVKDANGVTSEPVDATLAADGSYTATVPVAKLAGLADGKVTVAGDYNIPDVATGTLAHVGGVTMEAEKSTPAAPPRSDPPSANPGPPAAPAKIALSGLFMRSGIKAKSVAAGKLRVSFITPTGAQFVRVRLWRPGQTAALNIVAAGTPGHRQTVALTGAKASKLKKGATYNVTVSASPLKTMFVGPSLRGKVRIR